MSEFNFNSTEIKGGNHTFGDTGIDDTHRKQYVLGFRFDESRDNVVLIQKKRPNWQRGYLNGVGGKVERFDKNIFHAMVREFEEETSLKTSTDDWYNYIDMKFDGAIVYVFLSSGSLKGIKTTTDEPVHIYPISSLRINKHLNDKAKSYPLLNNLTWLIPMAYYNNIKWGGVHF